MTAQLVQFPLSTMARTRPVNAIAYPARATVMLPEMTLDIEPETRTYNASAPSLEEPSAPQVFSRGADVVLDLGDCTPMRTMLTLDAETALAWAAGLTKAALEARKVIL